MDERIDAEVARAELERRRTAARAAKRAARIDAQLAQGF